MAKKKSAKKSNLLAPVLRGIGWLWRLIAKTLGGMVRFIFRSSKELDPAHQRDGIAFFLFILAIISAAGVWFDLDNVLGRATYAQGWDMDRMPVLDRNILRLSIFELLWSKSVPEAVAISEALELATNFSTEDSSKYINGVLSKVLEIKPDLVL